MKETLRTPTRTGLKDTLRVTSSRSGLRDFVQRRNRSVSAPLQPKSAMPPSSNTTTTTSSTRFELPVLGTFESLTKGTNIPPPPDSPIEEHAPTLPQISTPAMHDPNSTTTPPRSSSYNNENQSPPHQDAPVSPVSAAPSSMRRFLSRKSLNQSYVNGNHSFEFDPNSRSESPVALSTTGRRKSSANWLKRLVGRSDDKKNGSIKRTSTVFEIPSEQQLHKGAYTTTPLAKKPNGVSNGHGVSNGLGNGLGNGVQTAAPAKKVDAGPPPPKLPELHQLKAKVDESTGSLGGEDMFASIGK